jgi:hypothetical protein
LAENPKSVIKFDKEWIKKILSKYWAPKQGAPTTSTIEELVDKIDDLVFEYEYGGSEQVKQLLSSYNLTSKKYTKDEK